LFQAFPKIQAVNPAIEIEHIAGSLTAEAVKQSAFLVDGKRRPGLLVKGAGGHPSRAVASEFHIAPRYIHKLQALFYLPYGISFSHGNHNVASCSRRRAKARRGDNVAVSEPKTTFFGETILTLKTQF
jgi:hypothetical protein